MLAAYADLHGLNRLDQANAGLDLSENPGAANTRAILQASEIALLNIKDLGSRITRDIEAGDIGNAEEKYRWVSSFQQTLHSLSLLAQKLPSPGEGGRTGIMDSASAAQALGELENVHDALKRAGLIEEGQIGEHDIHEPGRNLTHQVFVDSNYMDIWMNSLREINIPGLDRKPEEDDKAYYQRLVGTDAIRLAVEELDQSGDNFLRQFRAYH